MFRGGASNEHVEHRLLRAPLAGNGQQHTPAGELPTHVIRSLWSQQKWRITITPTLRLLPFDCQKYITNTYYYFFMTFFFRDTQLHTTGAFYDSGNELN